MKKRSTMLSPALFKLLFLASLVLIVASFCPSEEDIFPCKCEGRLVSCQNITLQEVTKALKPLTKKPAFTLNLFGIRLGNFSHTVFYDLHVRTLNVSRCSLGSILDAADATGAGLRDTLQSLNIEYSVSDVYGNFRLELGKFTRLMFLTINWNWIAHVSNNFISGSPRSLIFLSLGYNRIQTIGDKAFANLVNLKQLWLYENQIKVISRSMLPSSIYQLEFLNFVGNNITAIPENFFTNMPSVRHVEVDWNLLSDIPEKTWRPIWLQLQTVSFYGNPLICDSRLDWMVQLPNPTYLQGNCKYPPEDKSISIFEYLQKRRFNANYAIHSS